MPAYSRSQLLNKLSELVSGSDFLPNWLVAKAWNLSQENLEKLCIITFQTFRVEEKMSKQDKRKFSHVLIRLFQEKSHMYRKADKNSRDKIEAKSRALDMEEAEKFLTSLNSIE